MGRASRCNKAATEVYAALGYNLSSSRDSCHHDRRSLAELDCKPRTEQEIVPVSPLSARRVLLVIDVLNGYKRSFVNEEVHQREAKGLPPFPQVDRGWNAGFDIPASVHENINRAIGSLGGTADLLVFVQDYLDPLGSWKGQCFVNFLTLLAGHPGSSIQEELHLARIGTNPWCARFPGCTCKVSTKDKGIHEIHVITHRKTAFDAFDGYEAAEQPREGAASHVTECELYEDDFDASGQKNYGGSTSETSKSKTKKTLVEKLIRLGFSPTDNMIHMITSGLTTNTCVKLTTMSAKQVGYNVSYLLGGVAAQSAEFQKKGMQDLHAAGIPAISWDQLWPFPELAGSQTMMEDHLFSSNIAVERPDMIFHWWLQFYGLISVLTILLWLRIELRSGSHIR